MCERATEREELECVRSEHGVVRALVACGIAHGGCKIDAEETQHEGGNVHLELLAGPAALWGNQREVLVDTVLVRFVRVDITSCGDAAGNVFNLTGDDGQLI